MSVQPLAALDRFSAAGRETGLGPDLWRDASGDIARQVISALIDKPVSPAAAALARRVLAAGASGPVGAGSDPLLAAQRVQALTALGDARAAWTIAARASSLATDEPLSRAAAEAVLILGDEATACGLAEGLSVDRGGVYWLRLRSLCQLRAGMIPAAQLTFDLAQQQGRDAVFGRLMGAALAGTPADPAAASARTGLELVLSRRLGLDLTEALAKAPLAAARGALDGPPAAAVDAAQVQAAAARLLDDASETDPLVAERLIDRRLAGPAALLAALGRPVTPSARAQLAGFSLGKVTASPARLLALNLAAEQGRTGEAALIALSLALDAGAAGLALPERVAVVIALRRAGLIEDAAAFALEGLTAS